MGAGPSQKSQLSSMGAGLAENGPSRKPAGNHTVTSLSFPIRSLRTSSQARRNLVAANGAPGLKSLKQKLIQQGVKYCLGAYVDIHGVPKGKFVPIEHFEHFAHGSELYTGYALDGLGQAPNDDEISSVPDLGHIIQIPWRKEVA